MILLLNSVGLTSEIDGLRFSYEVSFTEDTTAQQFQAYMSCLELDAKENPKDTCINMMNAMPHHFVLFSDLQKEEVCGSIVGDIYD